MDGRTESIMANTALCIAMLTRCNKIISEGTDTVQTIFGEDMDKIRRDFDPLHVRISR